MQFLSYATEPDQFENKEIEFLFSFIQVLFLLPLLFLCVCRGWGVELHSFDIISVYQRILTDFFTADIERDFCIEKV